MRAEVGEVMDPWVGLRDAMRGGAGRGDSMRVLVAVC